MILCDQFGRALADHHRGRVDVAAGDLGHHTRVGDAEPRGAEHPQLRIDDAADPADAGQMIDGRREVQREILEQRIMEEGRLASIRGLAPRFTKRTE